MNEVEPCSAQRWNRNIDRGFYLLVSGYFVSPFVLGLLLFSDSKLATSGLYGTFELLVMILPDGAEGPAFALLLLTWSVLFGVWLCSLRSKRTSQNITEPRPVADIRWHPVRLTDPVVSDDVTEQEYRPAASEDATEQDDDEPPIISRLFDLRDRFGDELAPDNDPMFDCLDEVIDPAWSLLERDEDTGPTLEILELLATAVEDYLTIAADVDEHLEDVTQVTVKYRQTLEAVRSTRAFLQHTLLNRTAPLVERHQEAVTHLAALREIIPLDRHRPITH